MRRTNLAFCVDCPRGQCEEGKEWCVAMAQQVAMAQKQPTKSETTTPLIPHFNERLAIDNAQVSGLGYTSILLVGVGNDGESITIKSFMNPIDAAFILTHCVEKIVLHLIRSFLRTEKN